MSLPASIEAWSSHEVAQWLRQNALISEASQFFEHDIDGAVLLELNEDDLRNPPLKLNRLGSIKRLNKLIAELRRLEYGCGDPLSCDVPDSARLRSEKELSLTRSFRGKKSLDDKREQIPALQPEIGKVVVSFIYCLTVLFMTAFVMAVCHQRVPDMERYPPLPDLALDNIPFISWAFESAELCGLILGVIWTFVLVFHQYRFILLRRMFNITGTVFLLRSCTMIMTSLSVPNVGFQCIKHNYTVTQHAQQIFFGFGMAVQGVRTCGDYMFSGHTSILTMLNFLITEYTSSRFYYLHIVSWVLNLFGIFFILAAHEHYSIDVFIAFYIVSRLFLYYHTLANSPRCNRSKLQHRVWFPLFSFFEENCDVKVPNRFMWPIPSNIGSKFFFKQKTY